MHADPDAAARGAYLAAASGCDQCHTDKEHGGAPYAGGRVLATPFGKVTTPNLTGLARWTAADFAAAMRWGVAPDDTHYLPVFPFAFYARLSETDLADLKAFLDTLAPAGNPAAGGAAAPALFERSRAAIAAALAPPPVPWRPDPAHDAAWNRGAYLVATIGRCGDCHTPRDLLGRPVAGRVLAGSHGENGGIKAPNITPDPATGIGKWSEDDILALLKDGATPDFDFVGGAMAEIVRNTTRLSDADRRAIAAYLRTLPAKAFEKNE